MGAVIHAQLLTRDGWGVIGMLAYIVTPTFYSPELEGQELIYYIEPEFRSYKYAVQLIRAAEQDMFDRGATRITMGNTSGHRSASVEKLYTRLGYKSLSGNFYKEE